MTRLHAFYRPDIQRQLEAEPKPNPWQDIKLRDDPPMLPRVLRSVLKITIAVALAWWMFCWIWELCQ
jgi:hypothetical protein